MTRSATRMGAATAFEDICRKQTGRSTGFALLRGAPAPAALVSRRAYVISFAMFFACLLTVLAIAEMDSYQKETFSAQVQDEITAGAIKTAKEVLLASSKEVYTNYSFYKWSLAVKEYCGLEGMRCAVTDDAIPKATIAKDNMRTTFPIPRRW